jgi:hypothetical protein
VRAKEYEILTRAIEEGVAFGWTRAHKHTPTPETDHILGQIEQGVVNAICEVFDFEPSSSEVLDRS